MSNLRRRNRLTKQLDRFKEFLDSESGYATATHVVLALIAVAGIFVLMAGAPNIFRASRQFGRSRKFKKDQLQIAYQNLRKSGYIKTKKVSGKVYVEITTKGKRRLDEIDIDQLAIRKPWRWDGKWRLLMFDIPVRFRQAREAFRYKLKDLGLVQYQKSVWVYPYPCLDEVLYTADFFGVAKYVDYIESDYISREKEYKEIFELL